jgi:menaquinone-dependent protoporphyrinogen oxidase
MRMLIVYGSTRGQTHKIADFIAGRWRRENHDIAIFDAAELTRMVDPLRYDATLIAASLHGGRYQPSIARFAKEHGAELSSGPSAFVSVSLSAAGNDPNDLAGLKRRDDTFFADTGWHPTHVHHAAGAFAYTRYNLILRWYMKQIARKRGVSTDTSHDCEFTDYAALGDFVDGFLADATRSTVGTSRPGWAPARWAL